MTNHMFYIDKFGVLVTCFAVYVFPTRVQEMVQRRLITSKKTPRVPSVIQHLKVCTKTRPHHQNVCGFVFTGQDAGNLLSLGEGKLPDNVVMTP